MKALQRFLSIPKLIFMNEPTTGVLVENTFQKRMLASGMVFAFLQFVILMYVGSSLLPLIGPPGSPAVQRFEAFAKYADRFKAGNYLMTLPIPFFLLFLGGLIYHFRELDISFKSILFTSILSGVAFIMIWPMGAIISSIGLDIAVSGGDKVTVAVFDGIAPYSLGLSSVPKAVFLLTLAVILKDKKWLSASGYIVALINLAGSLIIANANFFMVCMFGNLLSLVWIFCCSLQMYRREKLLSMTPVASFYETGNSVL
jgi:hypothetical protein